MPDVETILEPWTEDQPRDGKMPDFENDDLLTVIDDVCGTCVDYHLYFILLRYGLPVLQCLNF